MRDLWGIKDMQFPRLLAEIVATIELTDEQTSELCASMDIEEIELDELFEHAQQKWDRLKAAVHREAESHMMLDMYLDEWLEMPRYWEVHPCHILEQDWRRLHEVMRGERKSELIVNPHCQDMEIEPGFLNGLFVHIGCEDEFIEDIRREEHFSQYLLDLFTIAKRHGCWWIKLDVEANPCKNLVDTTE
jgi:hypothetical protein